MLKIALVSIGVMTHSWEGQVHLFLWLARIQSIHLLSQLAIHLIPPNHRRVFFSQNKSVLLGTAMVNILHCGISYLARALIDHYSESSFLTKS